VAEDEVTSSGPGSEAPIPLSATLSYQHTFILPGDSTLALRGEALYSSSHGGHLTQQMKDDGIQPNVEVQSAVLGNVSATWAASKNLSVNGYVRNVANLQYFRKIDASLDNNSPPGVRNYDYQQFYNDPRTFGLVLNVSF